MEKKKLIIITGPTATGKTSVSLKLAKMLDGEILSADSMQIYDELMIGTARPDAEEIKGVKHHLMGFLKPNENYSTAQYKADAEGLIEDIYGRTKTPIIVGGTGLYINSLTYDIDYETPEADLKLREELNAEYDKMGAEYMYSLLQKEDEEASKRIHKNDKLRVVRALEIARKGGRNAYNFRKKSDKYDFRIIALTKPREILYRDIEKRVDIMFDMGLEAEVKNVYEKYGNDIQAFAAIGYKEFLPYFKGECSIKEVSDTIKKNTRHYAKRQMTWLRPDDRINWVDVYNNSCIFETICDIIR